MGFGLANNKYWYILQDNVGVASKASTALKGLERTKLQRYVVANRPCVRSGIMINSNLYVVNSNISKRS